MVAPISNDRIATQANEQGRTSRQERSDNATTTGNRPEATPPEATAKAEIEVSEAAKMMSQSGVNSSSVIIDSYEQAMEIVASIKDSLGENGSAALGAHSLGANQVPSLLQA